MRFFLSFIITFIITGLISVWGMEINTITLKNKTIVTKETLEGIFKDEVIKNSPWKDKANIIFENIRSPRYVEVIEKEKDAIQAKFSSQEDFMGYTTMTLNIGSGSNSHVVHISGHIKVLVEIPVIKSAIKRGSLITNNDIEIKLIDISTFPPVIMEKDKCIGMRTKTSLNPGKPILKSNIEEPPLISKGDLIFIEAKSDNLIIRDKGIALRDGYIEQKIPVRNANSGRQVFGTIIAASIVQVEF